jgi:hypothetical protein
MISGKLYDRLCGMTKGAVINLLLAALSEMQGYNGQSITSAIVRAAGGYKTDHGYVLPSKKQMSNDWAEQYPITD